MKKLIKFIGIALIATTCFLGATCGSNGGDFNFGEEYYTGSNAPQTAAAFRDITASQLVSEMTIGWNLGNTMDAHPGGETSWGNPKTTQENITAIKNAGFNTIRIPVSWYKSQAINMTTYEINESWMDRVTEIVNYAVNEDMYIILNSHHDEAIFKFSEIEKEKSLFAFKMIWSQIAFNFRNYNEKLIFEALNEPRTKGSSAEWSGGTYEERTILNEYYELFVKIVRNTGHGGNNDKRILSINTYAASAWNPAVDSLVLPKDTVDNKLLVQIHCYHPYNFALNTDNAYNAWSKDKSSDTNAVKDVFKAAYNKFGSKGVPIIMGEFGAMNKNNDDARSEWAEFYVAEAKKLGIPCIVWDNGVFQGSGERFAVIDRKTNTFPNPKYLDGLLKGAGVK